GALDLSATVQVLAIAKEHDADFVLIDVERDAVQIAGKFHQFIEAHAWKARDLGNADGQARDRADFSHRQLRGGDVQRSADSRERTLEDSMQTFKSVTQRSAFWDDATGSGPC